MTPDPEPKPHHVVAPCVVHRSQNCCKSPAACTFTAASRHTPQPGSKNHFVPIGHATRLGSLGSASSTSKRFPDLSKGTRPPILFRCWSTSVCDSLKPSAA